VTWSKLVRALTEDGTLPADLAAVFQAVPRSLFLPDTVHAGWEGEVVDRGKDPDCWLGLANSDVPLVIQFDDGQPNGDHTPSSSGSQPKVVALMMRQLGRVRGLDVCDVGTGTGWVTGLLEEAGANVTSVETDRAIGKLAKAKLAQAGYQPTLVIGDGTEPLGAGERVFDRIHSGAAVRHIPRAWIGQTRPGGLIVTPFGSYYCNGALVTLAVHKYGSASGRFSDNLSFMWVRSHRPTPLPARNLEAARYRPSGFDPRDLARNQAASFAVGLRIPGIRSRERWSDTIEWATGFSEVWDEGSFAHCRYADWDGPHAVAETGTRALWHEVQAAYTWWRDNGSRRASKGSASVSAPPENTACGWTTKAKTGLCPADQPSPHPADCGQRPGRPPPSRDRPNGRTSSPRRIAHGSAIPVNRAHAVGGAVHRSPRAVHLLQGAFLAHGNPQTTQGAGCCEGRRRTGQGCPRMPSDGPAHRLPHARLGAALPGDQRPLVTGPIRRRRDL
jgi:protein-L-isoaspartate O-methyltransferase